MTLTPTMCCPAVFVLAAALRDSPCLPTTAVESAEPLRSCPLRVNFYKWILPPSWFKHFYSFARCNHLPFFQLCPAWMVSSRESTTPWQAWLMQSRSSWLLTTSCLTSLYPPCWPALVWPVTGPMAEASGERQTDRQEMKKTPHCNKRFPGILLVYDQKGFVAR